MDTSLGRGGSPSISNPEYWWYQVRSNLLHSALAESVGDCRRILDVGSADGPSVEWLHEHGSVISLDIDPRGLRTPRAVCGSILRLPFRSDTFDLVSAFDVIEHCAPDVDAVREVARVLRPGGRMLISVPAYRWAWSAHDVANGHEHRYTRSRVVDVVERAGLSVRRATYAFTAVFPFFAAERLARKVVGKLARKTVGPADIVSVPRLPPTVESMMRSLTRFDHHALRRGWDLPFGSSILVAAVKPTATRKRAASAL